MRLDGCQVLGVPGHVVREGVRELGRQGLTALDALGGETKRVGLETGITRRHAKIMAHQGMRGIHHLPGSASAPDPGATAALAGWKLTTE
jgi:hypothetical protein